MSDSDDATRHYEEENELREWRVRRIRELGFNEVEAHQLADWEVDTHSARSLVERGCPHSTAVRILQPLR